MRQAAGRQTDRLRYQIGVLGTTLDGPASHHVSYPARSECGVPLASGSAGLRQDVAARLIHPPQAGLNRAGVEHGAPGVPVIVFIMYVAPALLR